MNGFARMLRHTDLLMGLGLLVIVGMLLLPLPHWLLDSGLVIALTMSVVIFLMTVNVVEPLEFSSFPSILLVTTLFRLALSIAATKLILGTGQAGHVIQAFGDFVMGGDPVVGFVAFLILVIVQFMVITNGAGRVSEVTARFTLDAMPGKQMAIDADLQAGLIDEEQAKERRKKIQQEADFVGSMEGASKFVKGDAIAAILIIAINILGGFVVGFMRGQGDALTILKQYTILSVGEGLVSQMPALLISTASGLLVTRSGSERSMGGQVLSQVLGQPKALSVGGGALVLMGLVPGFPATLFVGAGLGLFMLSRFLQQNPKSLQGLDVKPKASAKSAPMAQAGQGDPTKPAVNNNSPEAVLPLLSVEPLELEIGYGLTRLADSGAGGDLTDRISATRRQIASELGFVMPMVRIRDNTSMRPDEYLIKVRGEEVARSTCQSQGFLAVSGGMMLGTIPGIPTKDPVFGLDALWIEPNFRESAERAGYTVIEPGAVMATHLAEIVKSHAAELLSRQDVVTLVEQAKTQNEAAIKELIPEVMQVGDVQKVLQHLLRERVPIRDTVTIMETLADFGPRCKDPEQLGELVRAAISRTITRQYVDSENRLFCLTLEPSLERELTEKVSVTSYGTNLVIDAGRQRQVIDRLEEQMNGAIGQGQQPVLLCSTALRLPMRRLLERYLPTLHVLAYNEVAARADVEFVGQVRAMAA